MEQMTEKSVSWIESTRESYWQTSEPVETSEKQSNLITANKGRVVEGFGSCFNELGMSALNH
jgi:glucosylceramidase